MKTKVAFVAALVAAFALACQSADAHSRKKLNPILTGTSIAVGTASTAGYLALNDWRWNHWDSARHGVTSLGAWGLTTMGCAALSPIVATAILKRPLKYREAHILVGSCVIPIVGGWLVNEAYNNHILTAPDEVEPAAAPRRHRHKHKHHHHM